MSAAHAHERAPIVSPSLDAQRQAEMEAGRARLQELHKSAGHKDADLKHVFSEADKVIKDDEKRREELLTVPAGQSGRARPCRRGGGGSGSDRAGSRAPQRRPARRRSSRPSTRLRSRAGSSRRGHRDKAEELTTDMVTAQAVNQPVVLANERGEDTENKPPNPHDI
jgi:hypothetical protein